MRTKTLLLLSVVVACAVTSGCGGGGSSSSGPAPAPGSDPTDPGCEDSFDSTFAAIQTVVFERHGCTQDACHGSARQGGLDLRPDAAYASLIEVASQGSTLARVVPGSPDRSYFFHKLAASTRPGSFTISGSPMPSGLPALSEEELEAIRIWIKGGAPEEDTVGHPDTGSSDAVGELLDACLPPAEPITIRPREPPAPGDGVQLAMPAS
jgi:hypothetical protein